jgi:hypothetical protein
VGVTAEAEGFDRRVERASRIPVTGAADQATWASLDIALDKLRK